MEEMLQKCNQKLRLITNQNELKYQQLLNQIESKENKVEIMSRELEIKSKQLEDVQRHRDEKDKALRKQIKLLRIEIRKLMSEEHALSKLDPIELMTIDGNHLVSKFLTKKIYEDRTLVKRL